MDYFWTLALLAPVSFAASNVIDNHVMHSILDDPIVYDVLSTWPTILVAVGIFLAWKVSFAFGALVVGTLIGLAFSFLIILYNAAMKQEHGANVVSVIYASPLFVAVLASVFLGEYLTVQNYVGIVLLVGSVFLVLFKRFDTKNIALGLVLIFSFASASARVVAKSVLSNVDVWSYFFWLTIGSIIGVTLLAISRRGAVASALRKSDRRLWAYIALTDAFSSLGIILLYSAFSIGSVALASGLTALQPTIVLLYSAALLRLRPGAIPADRVAGRWANGRKLGALVLIVLGTLALSGI